MKIKFWQEQWFFRMNFGDKYRWMWHWEGSYRLSPKMYDAINRMIGRPK